MSSSETVSFRRGDFCIALHPHTGKLVVERQWGENGFDTIELSRQDAQDLVEFIANVLHQHPGRDGSYASHPPRAQGD